MHGCVRFFCVLYYNIGIVTFLAKFLQIQKKALLFFQESNSFYTLTLSVLFKM